MSNNLDKSASEKTDNKEGWVGIYVKSLRNNSDSGISLTIKESHPDKFISLSPNESRGSDFPFPWASNAGDDYKCIILQIGNKRIALWDNDGGKAYCNPSGEHWSPDGDLISGSNGHGDYEMVFNSDLSFELRKRS